MASKYFLPGVAPLREALQLGSLVPNIRQPDQDAFSCLEVEEGRDFLVYQQQNLGKLMDATKNSSFKTKVTQLLAAAFEKTEKDSRWLAPCQVRHYQLSKPKELFKQLCKLEQAREWLQSEIEDGARAVYFIVGYYTALDATVNRTTHQGSQTSLEAQIPIGDIISAGATAPFAGSIGLDLGGGVGRGSGYTTKDSARSPGERIYAFCYRKVTFSFFALQNKIGTAKLQSANCWKMTSDNRGDGDGEDDEGVEASLDEMEEDEEGEECFEISDTQDGEQERS